MKKRWISMLLCAVLVLGMTACGTKEENADDVKVQSEGTNGLLAQKYNATNIVLSDDKIMVDGKEISNNPNAAVYKANDIVFYLEGQDFTYGEGKAEDGHSQEEADAHTVVHIAEPGNYVLSGKLSAGQIAVDLGDGAKKDSEAVVTLILNGMDITCSVAPGVIFYNVYECGDDDTEDAVKDVDTSEAGANIIIADESVNFVNGSYVAKIYEDVELNEAGTEVVDSKKLHKYDAAFYSRRSMNIAGEEKGNGVLNIQAENEGLGSELHLTINGGVINITSGNDGINTNEDGVSVMTINGGNLNVEVKGTTGEGDGIDSNGWLVVNGGTVQAFACGFSMDSGIDSDMGIHINGGMVIATGNMLDEIGESKQTYAVFTSEEVIEGGTGMELKNKAGDTVVEAAVTNSCTRLIVSSKDLQPGTYTLWYAGEKHAVSEMNGGMFGRPRDGGGKPDGEMPQFLDGEPPQMPKDFERPDFGGGDIANMEAVEEFTIKEGANMFLIAK